MKVIELLKLSVFLKKGKTNITKRKKKQKSTNDEKKKIISPPIEKLSSICLPIKPLNYIIHTI